MEETIIKYLDLPSGRDWRWYPDANIVVVNVRLDDAGRQRARDELAAHWRAVTSRNMGVA